MYGNSTLAGPESADSRESGNCGRSNADTFRLLRSAKAALEARGEWRLAREIEDACARWDSEEASATRSLPLGEGERSGKALHGENPQDAEEVAAGMAWWNGLTEQARAFWCQDGCSVAEAYRMWKARK